MIFKEENWHFCGTCHCVSYTFDCCGNSTCNAGGCEECKDRTEVNRRIECGEYPAYLKVSSSLFDDLLDFPKRHYNRMSSREKHEDI